MNRDHILELWKVYATNHTRQEFFEKAIEDLGSQCTLETLGYLWDTFDLVQDYFDYEDGWTPRPKWDPSTNSE